MSSALDLVVLNGPREGELIQLRPSAPLRLGRSLKGYQLVDPLVSLNHAEINWEGDCYWVEDLGSATGTFVNDVRLADKPVVLVPGARLRLGETVIEVRVRPRSAMLRIVGAVAAMVLFVMALVQYRRSIVIEYEPLILWNQPVRQGQVVNSKVVRIPEPFIRDTGIDHRSLRIQKVTDYDNDAVDELWLTWPGGARLVTFDVEGNWRTLADLPADCKEKPRTLSEGLPAECYVAQSQIKTELPEACRRYGQFTGFPDLDCTGSTWRFTDGEYRIMSQEGVVAWMPPTKEEEVMAPVGKKGKMEPVKVRVADQGPLVPYLFTLSKTPQLAGFLADRGINEPVHYLVCEDAVTGIKPQVLTQSGRIIQLPVGCLAAIDILGPTRVTEFGDVRPKMVAFTGTGYRQLVKDLAVYLSGAEDDSYMSPAKKKTWQALIKSPERRQGGVRITFDGPEQMFEPVAREGELVVKDRLTATEFGEALPPRAWTITIPKTGRYDLEGCSELDVRFQDWHCASSKGCGEGDTFITIRNVGCDVRAPTAITYRAGPATYQDGHVNGRVIVETASSGRQIDVLRVRFTYTLAEPAAGGPATAAGAPAAATPASTQ